MELDEHFYHLKVKYKATSYHNDNLLNPLYLILRKADASKALIEAEWQWLSNQDLLETIEIIKSEIALRSALLEKINAELRSIIHDNNFSHFLTITKTGIYGISESEILMKAALTIYRINANEVLNHEDITLINRQTGIYIDEKTYNQFICFEKIKKKYSLNKDFPFDMELYGILKKVEELEQLSAKDIQSFIDYNLINLLTLYKDDFVQLQNKYKAIIKGKVAELQLYPILKKLDENRMLSSDEFDWLRSQNYIETTAIARETEFVALKKKFGADQIEEKTLPHHLYTILVKIDSDTAISEADINYLRKRMFFKTICIALKLHFKYEVTEQINSMNSQLCEILYKLEIGERLNNVDVSWLTSEKWFRGNRIYQRYHSLEAIFCEQEYERTKNTWNIVNASSHWRKAGDPQKALNSTDILLSNSIKEVKLKAALLTTRGGALRDIGHLDETENFAHQAIQYYPKSYHPYTLLGAICFQMGRYGEGEYWFDEARKRGAPEKSEISEIIGILKKTRDKKEQEKFLAFLKEKYPSYTNKFKAVISGHSINSNN
ncbi:MAG: hypothetical protein F9K25_04660 [Candidatus Contendobacter sp.]|nr:MAG: hypothetical protein F9K25_04660 [Candidatus Contendobacter sp.]